MKQELGPTYNVPLIESLPINRANPDGWTQAMPSRADLLGVRDYRQGQRVVAGYEVLLNHWREQGEELANLRAGLRAILDGRLRQGRPHEHLPWSERISAWAATVADDLELLLSEAAEASKGSEP